MIDLDHLLDPGQLPANAALAAEQVQHYLEHLLATVATSGDEWDQQVAAHINRTVHNRWWGLFACYRVPGLPRTNNELETFLRRLKTGQRRITGRKNVHDFIVRYGRFVAFIDHTESQEALLARLRQVPLDDFVREQKRLDSIQELAEKRHRFRHRQVVFLAALENRWTAACAQSATS